jgi:hypothetical protein
MTRQQANANIQDLDTSAHQPGGSSAPEVLPPILTRPAVLSGLAVKAPHETGAQLPHESVKSSTADPRSPSRRRAAALPRPAAAGQDPHASPAAHHRLLRDASLICQTAAANGERLSQRALARQLRDHGHRFSNEHLHGIAATIGLTTGKAA